MWHGIKETVSFSNGTACIRNSYLARIRQAGKVIPRQEMGTIIV